MKKTMVENLAKLSLYKGSAPANILIRKTGNFAPALSKNIFCEKKLQAMKLLKNIKHCCIILKTGMLFIHEYNMNYFELKTHQYFL